MIEPCASYTQEQAHTPRYDLPPEEVQRLEAEMAAVVKSAHGETVAAVWIPSGSPYADVVRTHELDKFPEIADVMAPYERASRFLAFVDTRQGANRVVHAFRVSSPGLAAAERAGTEAEDSVDIAFVQDLVASGQITEADFVTYYKARGVSLDDSVSVETNFRVGEKVAPINGVPVTHLGYLTLFNAASSPETDAPERMVFAHLNRVAVISLSSMGVSAESVMGDPDLKTPTVDNQFDPKYHPAAIPVQQTAAVFRQLSNMAPPVIEL